jgi:carbon-monoxide dehydrogenase iron sulfur subunit
MKDVSIKIVKIEGECSKHKVGDRWVMKNGTLYDPDNKGICIYALNAIMPMLPLKETEVSEEDHWIHKYEEFLCPDINGRAVFRVEPIADQGT